MSASPTTSPSAPPTCYTFRMPPSYASVLRQAGFTVLNSANNHSHDFGERGSADTTAALRQAGIAQTGLPGQIAVVEVGGVRVAFLGFAPYATANNLLDVDAARRLIAAAHREADLVVVSMHAGAEGAGAAHVTGREERYAGEDRGNPQAFAHAAIDAGADVVVGSGPHVLRGLEYYHGHLIAYSLGNFAGYRNFSTTGVLRLSGILRVSLSDDGSLRAASFTSLVLDGDGRPALDPSHAAADFVNRLSVADFGLQAVLIQGSGNLALPGTATPSP
ncbi:MAG: CapA family protein [Acidothermus sp.]|nr:CapA family protein [Acidothermus sp.]